MEKHGIGRTGRLRYNEIQMANLYEPGLEVSAFFEMTPDLVCVADKDGFLKNVNHAVVEKLGYTREELFAQQIAVFMHPDDRELTSQHRSALLGGQPLINFENRYIAKNGDIIWLAWTSIYFPDKEIVFAIAKDVTVRKLMEKEVEQTFAKYKSLATHFKSSMEEDRRYLATELHDELAQLASVIKMDIDWVKLHEPHLQTLSLKRIEHAAVISDLLIDTIRRLSFSISPQMIVDMGLYATLRLYCKEFALLNNLSCVFKSEYDEVILTPDIKIDFFRICQEVLNNVTVFSDASHITIRIEGEGNVIKLSILGDGPGADMGNTETYRQLTAVRERVASMNGKLSVTSAPGTGSHLCVTIAVPPAA